MNSSFLPGLLRRACARARAHTHTHPYTYVPRGEFTWIPVWPWPSSKHQAPSLTCVCVCVCVSVSVCVCVCVRVSTVTIRAQRVSVCALCVYGRWMSVSVCVYGFRVRGQTTAGTCSPPSPPNTYTGSVWEDIEARYSAELPGSSDLEVGGWGRWGDACACVF